LLLPGEVDDVTDRAWGKYRRIRKVPEPGRDVYPDCQKSTVARLHLQI